MFEVIEPPGIGNLASIIQAEFDEATDLITSLLRDTWKEKAVETRSYLSGDYYRNIRKDGLSIVSDIGYGDIIESIGWGASNPPRFPAEKAIAAAEGDIEKILSDAAGRVVDIVEG